VGTTLAVIARFRAARLPVEVFGQPLPIDRQRGYRHLLVEARLLAGGGAALRSAVTTERRAGLKTEPAFARALGLDGDPYERLWTLSWREDDEVRAVLAAAGFARSA
jgi:hypothetical protein